MSFKPEVSTDGGRTFHQNALCESCHRGALMGLHGQRRAWAIHKMDETDALNVTIQRLMELKA